jgi:heterogeneous nuclear ribonucleoprotein R
MTLSHDDVSEDVEEVEAEDDYEDQVEQEHFDVGDADIIDEDLDREGGVEEEDEKHSGKEGLDLDMCEDDGNGYQDELDDQDERDGIGYQEQSYVQNVPSGSDEPEIHIQEKCTKEFKYEACDGDTQMKTRNADKKALSGENGIERACQAENALEESTENPLSLPEHGSEVFVGNISKDTVEADLRELCARCGDIFEVRLSPLKRLSGRNNVDNIEVLR